MLRYELEVKNRRDLSIGANPQLLPLYTKRIILKQERHFPVRPTTLMPEAILVFQMQGPK